MEISNTREISDVFHKSLKGKIEIVVLVMLKLKCYMQKGYFACSIRKMPFSNTTDIPIHKTVSMNLSFIELRNYTLFYKVRLSKQTFEIQYLKSLNFQAKSSLFCKTRSLWPVLRPFCQNISSTHSKGLHDSTFLSILEFPGQFLSRFLR